ncbi:hypothetical protein GQX74_002006 [Glossina fuscipes]|nr:hypothetical protein GQX74_002006 [Glossina fuscipes]
MRTYAQYWSIKFETLLDHRKFGNGFVTATAVITCDWVSDRLFMCFKSYVKDKQFSALQEWRLCIKGQEVGPCSYVKKGDHKQRKNAKKMLLACRKPISVVKDSYIHTWLLYNIFCSLTNIGVFSNDNG